MNTSIKRFIIIKIFLKMISKYIYIGIYKYIPVQTNGVRL